MPVSLDPSFSVYALTERVQKRESGVLNHRRTMNLVSYEIENATLVDGARTRIFSSFQRMSRFLPQMERYRKLAERAESVYVFGIPDVIPPEIPNITYIYLKPTDQLSKEWFLISYGQNYASVLSTEELTRIDDPDNTRMFKGIWSFDLSMASILENWLTNTVDAPALMISEDQHDFRHQARLVSNIMNRLLMKVMVDMDPTRSAILQGELRRLIKDTLHPIVAASAEQAEANEVREHEAVILFSDLRNFSSMTETMNVSDLVGNILNPYVNKVTENVYKHGGVIDKFLGDGVLAVFGHENPGPQDADRAVQAAMAAMRDLQHEMRVLGLGIGFGIARGPVRFGRIGSDLAYDETVIGDAVNIAQRLSNYAYNDIWISESVVENLSNRSRVNDKGLVVLKGKANPQQAYAIEPEAGGGRPGGGTDHLQPRQAAAR